MSFPRRFPVYAIASTEGVLALTIDNKLCALLFETRQLAEAHIEKVTALGLSELDVLEIPDARALREGLKSLPKEVTCVLWDSGESPDEFEYIRLGICFVWSNSAERTDSGMQISVACGRPIRCHRALRAAHAVKLRR